MYVSSIWAHQRCTAPRRCPPLARAAPPSPPPSLNCSNRIKGGIIALNKTDDIRITPIVLVISTSRLVTRRERGDLRTCAQAIEPAQYQRADGRGGRADTQRLRVCRRAAVLGQFRTWLLAIPHLRGGQSRFIIGASRPGASIAIAGDFAATTNSVMADASRPSITAVAVAALSLSNSTPFASLSNGSRADRGLDAAASAVILPSAWPHLVPPGVTIVATCRCLCGRSLQPIGKVAPAAPCHHLRRHPCRVGRVAAESPPCRF